MVQNVSHSQSSSQTNGVHNPNPFDFVPFADYPHLLPEAEFDQMGELLSGYFELSIKALTPIHVIGSQITENGDRRSSHYRQNGEPCIPAATIRGCLRSFIEALTSGWVSQATPEYEYEKWKRHRAYKTFSENPPYTEDPAVNAAYEPQITDGRKLDLASYLFGLVIEKKEGTDSSHSDLARKTKIWVEDAYILPDLLDDQQYWLPDMEGDAIVGGAHPSASSWWYMKPSKPPVVECRVVNHGRFKLAEFVGEKYRGRKFYFHQKPENCLPNYLPENWSYPPDHPFRKTALECMKPGSQTKTFRIYVNRVPRRLLTLFTMCLFPGRMRHKLGSGKAFGYGSLSFDLVGVRLREEDHSTSIPTPLTDWKNEVKNWQRLAWDKQKLSSNHLNNLIDWKALEWLAYILGLKHSGEMIYLYPGFTNGFFQTAVRYERFEQLSRGLPINPRGTDIAKALYATKRTIDFRLYQECSLNWDLIKQRVP